MAQAKYLPKITQAILDPNTGLITGVWYDFFLSVYSQTGGGAGNNSDIFNYPTGSGIAGQILTSQGIGLVSTWKDQLTKVSQLQNDLQFIPMSVLVDYAKLASPALTGAPTAPTASLNTNTTQLATTAFVLNQGASATPLMDSGAGTTGSSPQYARQDHRHPTDTSRLPTANPVATGSIALNGVSIFAAAGDPGGVVSAAAGSLYLRTDAGHLYVCTGGNSWSLAI